MGGRFRLLVVLCVLVFAAAALAGCVAAKKDERDQVIRTWNREQSSGSQAETVTFVVPKDVDRLKIAVSTKPPKDDGGGWDWEFEPCFSPPCDYEQGSSTPSGYVQVTVYDAHDNIQGRIERLSYDSSDSLIVPQPVAGTWRAQVRYTSYDGPIALSVAEPASSGGAASSPIWDILGVVLGVATIVGGVVVVRRRGQHLSRELHRIDQTYSKVADVEECRANLLEMKDHLARLLVSRKIEESQYLILEKRIEQYLSDLDTPGNRHSGAAPPAPPEGVARFRRSDG